MTLPTFEKQEDIPEAFRDSYEEKDGKWVPKVDEPSRELESALRTEREGRKAADDARKKAERELADLRTKAKASESGISDEKLKEIREQVETETRNRYEEEYGPFKTEAEKLKNENRALRLDHAVKDLMAKSGVRAERIDALWRLTQDRFDLTTDGKPMLKDKPGGDLTKYIGDTVKTEFPEFFQGTKGDGGGAGGSQRNGNAAAANMSHEDFTKLSTQEKMRVAREAEAAKN